MTCNITEHKRCYNKYVSYSSQPILTCQCLKGLYTTENNECIGALRFDLTLYIYMPPSLVNQNEVRSQLKDMIQHIPLNSTGSLISSKNHGMDLESNLFLVSSDTKSVVVYNKVVLWKKNAISPIDLPNISVNEMSQFLFTYFSNFIAYDNSSDQTYIGKFLIGYGIKFVIFMA